TLHPLVKDIIIENQKLAEELSQISLARSTLSQERKQLNETQTSTKKRFDAIKQKVSQIGLTDAIGLKLRNERKRLPNVLEYAEKQKLRRSEINRVQLRRVEIEEKMMALTDARREALRLLNNYEPPIEETEKNKLLEPIQNALTQQKDKYLKELLGSYDIYFEKNLFPIMEDERSLISLVRDYRIYIDTHILWVQSAPSLELSNFKQVSSATLWLLNPSSMLRVFSNLKTDLSYNTFSFLLPLALIAALFPVERRLKPFVKNKSATQEFQTQNELISALQMLSVSLLRILPGPLFLAFLAWRLTQGPLPSIYGNAIASGLNALAVVLFMGLFLRKTCQDHQLGQSYLNWQRTTCQRINQQLRWFLPSASSFLFITMITMDQPTQSHHDSLGRLSFMILMLLTGIFIRKINPPLQQIKRADEANTRWLTKVQKNTLSLVFLIPFILLIGTANGYVYTCLQLAIYTFKTLSLVFIFNIIHDFALGALALAFQKNKTVAKNTAAQQLTAEHTENPTALSDLDQNTLSTQAIKTLTTIYWIAVFSGLTLIWSEVLTAFNLFNDIVLWHSISTPDTAGASPIDTPVTLANLLMAIIILFLTFFISRNIAGLLEIVILQRLPLSPSGRYAITSIARYAVTIIGIALTFNSIGIGWSKVQWLAAAITLGLGFGLQEIFANFVSGLIILFERPVRIGDSVTVGNISGKVTRIQMRATTITDWDRKELIIPNKEFVTGQVINWSLTDTILRSLVPVGVAYGSDLDLTYNILLDIAKQHPSVLKDPGPSVRL
ncbi:MAG TPA: mechanosensitive ion channel domain-containing protein, partial [Pseudomonadales bacterium]|nr:mechanosensitive ion channel domain-containing protein [Pseudomonadales bacterium]